eukprot:Hpha_TRINITY_DN16709_c3_g5::TRINITY_DN16709_c3_g5_i1::g.78186::m.78186
MGEGSPRAWSQDRVTYLQRYGVAEKLDGALKHLFETMPSDPVAAMGHWLLKGSADDSTSDIQESEERPGTPGVASYLELLVKAVSTHGFAAVISAALSQLGEHAGMAETRTAVRDWCTRSEEEEKALAERAAARALKKKKKKSSKWGDGLKVPMTLAREAEFYPPGYTPGERSVWVTLSGLEHWATPEGVGWQRESVKDMIHGAKLICSLHAGSTEEAVVAPAYAYSAQLLLPEVWLAWKGTRWSRIADYMPEQSPGPALVLPPGVADEAGLQTTRLPFAKSFACGLTAWGEGEGVVVRYRNVWAGTQLSPLRDAVAWLPSPSLLLGDTRWAYKARNVSHRASLKFHQDFPDADGINPGVLPYPGVLERIASRSISESLFGTQGVVPRKASNSPAVSATPRGLVQGVIENSDWSSSSYGNADISALIADCLALKNQQKENEELCARVEEICEADTEFGIVFKRKTGRAVLTPELVNKAASVQRLNWYGESFIASLSGKPRLLHHCLSQETQEMWRSYSCYDFQPFALVNEAMRNLHTGTVATQLLLNKDSGAPPGTYLAVDAFELRLHAAAEYLLGSLLPKVPPKESLPSMERRETTGPMTSVFFAAVALGPALMRHRGVEVPDFPGGLDKPLMTGESDEASVKQRIGRLQGLIRAGLVMAGNDVDPELGERLLALATHDSSPTHLVMRQTRAAESPERAAEVCKYVRLRGAEKEKPTTPRAGGEAGEDPLKTAVTWNDALRCWMLCEADMVKWTFEPVAELGAGGVAKLVRGTFLLPIVRSFIYFLQQGLQTKAYALPQQGGGRYYRGIKGVVVSALGGYESGRLVRWPSFSSSSADQGVACSFAQGGGAATVFTIKGHYCRNISPNSRFCREEEWLFPANASMRVEQLLSPEVQEVLGRSGFQIVELCELSAASAHRTLIRGLLGHAETAAAAAVVFRAEAAATGDGVLDLALKYPYEGTTSPVFQLRVVVDHNASGQCPDKILEHSTAWRAGGKSSAWYEIQPDLQGIAWEVALARGLMEWEQDNRLLTNLRLAAHSSFEERQRRVLPTPAEDAARLLGMLALPDTTRVTLGRREDGPGFQIKLCAPAVQLDTGVKLIWTSNTPFQNAKRKDIAKRDYTGVVAALSEADGTVDVRWFNKQNKFRGEATMSINDLRSRSDFAPESGWHATITARLTPARAGQGLGVPGAKILGGVLELGVPIANVAVANNMIGSEGAKYLLDGLKHCPSCVEVSLGSGADIQSSVRRAVALRCAYHACVKAEQDTLPFELFDSDGWGGAAVMGLAGVDQLRLPWRKLCRPSDVSDAAVLLAAVLRQSRQTPESHAPSDALRLCSIVNWEESKVQSAVAVLACRGAALSDLGPALVLAAHVGTPAAARALLGLRAPSSGPGAKDERGRPPVF